MDLDTYIQQNQLQETEEQIQLVEESTGVLTIDTDNIDE